MEESLWGGSRCGGSKVEVDRGCGRGSEKKTDSVEEEVKEDLKTSQTG